MGQRLNLEIQNNGELLANCYYHWSAYTDSALEIASIALDALYSDFCENLNPKQKALYMLHSTGATVTEEELPAVKEAMGFDFEFDTDAHRNKGLIAVTQEGMQETRDWEEGRVVIDIGKEIVDFGVFFTLDEDELEEGDVVSDLHYMTRCIPFADWDSFRNELESIGSYFRDLDNDCLMGKIQ